MTAAAYVDPVLACGAILGALGFVGMAMVAAIQSHHNATAETRARKAERRAEWHKRENDRLTRSNERLRQLLERQADENAERLADLVSVVGTDTAEDPKVRAS